MSESTRTRALNHRCFTNEITRSLSAGGASELTKVDSVSRIICVSCAMNVACFAWSKNVCPAGARLSNRFGRILTGRAGELGTTPGPKPWCREAASEVSMGRTNSNLDKQTGALYQPICSKQQTQHATRAPRARRLGRKIGWFSFSVPISIIQIPLRLHCIQLSHGLNYAKYLLKATRTTRLSLAKDIKNSRKRFKLFTRNIVSLSELLRCLTHKIV